MGKVAFSACLAICMLAAVAAAQPSTWLRDYLEPPKAKAMSGHYDRMDTKTVCFRPTNFCTRDDCGCTTSGYSGLSFVNGYYNLACTECPEEHTYGYEEHRPYGYERHHDLKTEGYDLVAESLDLSKCYVTLSRHTNGPVPVAGSKVGALLLGTFYGLCHINENAPCAPEGCEGVEVTITGLLYRIPNAVRVGPQNSDPPQVCSGPPPLGPFSAGPNSDGKASTGANIAATTAASNVPTVAKGEVTVWTGPFTVHSAGHRKYERGYFQYSNFATTSQQPADTVTTLPRFGDQIFQFEFINEHPPMHRD